MIGLLQWQSIAHWKMWQRIVIGKCKEPMKGTHPNYNFIQPTEMPKQRCFESKPWWLEIVEDEEDDFEDFSLFHVGNRW